MKSLQKFSSARLFESTGILDYNYEVQPYDWRKFKELVIKNKNIEHLVHPDDEDVEFLYDPKTKEILARYEGLDLEVWTSIPKSDFFKSIRGSKDLIKKYLN
jgi:hypothetical protein